jgi:hypothetical protein
MIITIIVVVFFVGIIGSSELVFGLEETIVTVDGIHDTSHHKDEQLEWQDGGIAPEPIVPPDSEISLPSPVSNIRKHASHVICGVKDWLNTFPIIIPNECTALDTADYGRHLSAWQLDSLEHGLKRLLDLRQFQLQSIHLQVEYLMLAGGKVDNESSDDTSYVVRSCELYIRLSTIMRTIYASGHSAFRITAGVDNHPLIVLDQSLMDKYAPDMCHWPELIFIISYKQVPLYCRVLDTRLAPHKRAVSRWDLEDISRALLFRLDSTDRVPLLLEDMYLFIKWDDYDTDHNAPPSPQPSPPPPTSLVLDVFRSTLLRMYDMGYSRFTLTVAFEREGLNTSDPVVFDHVHVHRDQRERLEKGVCIYADIQPNTSLTYSHLTAIPSSCIWLDTRDYYHGGIHSVMPEDKLRHMDRLLQGLLASGEFKLQWIRIHVYDSMISYQAYSFKCAGRVNAKDQSCHDGYPTTDMAELLRESIVYGIFNRILADIYDAGHTNFSIIVGDDAIAMRKGYMDFEKIYQAVSEG